MARTAPAEILIIGEPASKANSRRAVWRGSHMSFIKSKKALSYVDIFNAQCPPLSPLFSGDLYVYMEIFYGSKRPDLDESLILDCLQGRAYGNDRQVKKKEIIWGLDRGNPRTFIRIRPLESGDCPIHQGYIQGGKGWRGNDAPLPDGGGGMD